MNAPNTVQGHKSELNAEGPDNRRMLEAPDEKSESITDNGPPEFKRPHFRILPSTSLRHAWPVFLPRWRRSNHREKARYHASCTRD